MTEQALPDDALDGFVTDPIDDDDFDPSQDDGTRPAPEPEDDDDEVGHVEPEDDSDLADVDDEA